MRPILVLCLCAVIVPAVIVTAAEPLPKDKKTPTVQAKELSGMSIVGNEEAPKSLYIIPWKSSEIGVETSLGMMLNKDDAPVDRDVFTRQLDFYEVSNALNNERRK